MVHRLVLGGKQAADAALVASDGLSRIEETARTTFDGHLTLRMPTTCAMRRGGGANDDEFDGWTNSICVGELAYRWRTLLGVVGMPSR